MTRWASGVSIVTTRLGERIHGMTVSDFSGASLDPPLVTICCNRESRTAELIAEAGCFAVNVLAADQAELSDRFASSKTEQSRFQGLETEVFETGSPIIRGGLANFDCSVVARHQAGDHVIYLGSVEAARVRDGEPLLYFSGGYRVLAAEDDA